MKIGNEIKALLVLIVIGFLFFSLNNLTGGKNKPKEVIPQATKKTESPSKAETYFISSKVLPQFTEVTFDPYNVKLNEKQTVTIRVKNTESLKSVYLILNTDNKKQRYDLKLSEGTLIDGNWQGSWTFSDTRDKIYSFTFYAVSQNKGSNIDFSFGKEFPKSNQ